MEAQSPHQSHYPKNPHTRLDHHNLDFVVLKSHLAF